MTKRGDTYTLNLDIDSEWDGDTYHVTLHWDAPPVVGITSSMHHKLRLIGINCPELKTPEGVKAAAFAKDWLARHTAPYRVLINGSGKDKYNDRFDGRLIAADGACLNDDLLSSNNAVVMKG